MTIPAEWEGIYEGAHKTVPMREGRVSVVRADIEVIQDVSSVVTGPVQTSFSVRCEGIRRGPEAVGLVMGDRVRVLKGQVTGEAASHFDLESIVIGDRAVIARQDFPEIWESEVLLSKLRRAH